jgi:hypothetical protein
LKKTSGDGGTRIPPHARRKELNLKKNQAMVEPEFELRS